MKPRPRSRKAVKWGGLGVCAVTATAWIPGAWGTFIWHTPRFAAGAGSGAIGFGWGDTTQVMGPNPPGFRTELNGEPELVWWPEWTQTGSFQAIVLPIWMLFLPACCATLAAWRLDTLARRRGRAGHCPKCAYDRRGIAVTGPCPECGTTPAGDTLKA